MLNLDRLRTLHAVAEHGSVTGAANVLHLTTSAVSQQLAKLERELGQPLLERQGRGVRLTDAATLLVTHTDRILALVEQAHAALEAQRDDVLGDLSVAAFATAARGLVPPALVALRAQHPQLRVTLQELEPRDSVPLLARGDLDLAIVLDWSNALLAVPRGLQRAALLDDVVDVALPASHSLAVRSSVDLSDLADEPWVCWQPGEFCHDCLLATLRARGIEPTIAHTVSEHATQLALVGAGLGVAAIPRLGRDPLPGGVTMVAVRPVLVRHVYVVWRADAARRPAVQAAVDALTQAGRSAGA